MPLRENARIADIGLGYVGLPRAIEYRPDIRNTKVFDSVSELQSYSPHVYDPWADGDEVRSEFGLRLVGAPVKGGYDAIIVAVAHDEIQASGSEGVHALGRELHVTDAIGHVLSHNEVDGRL